MKLDLKTEDYLFLMNHGIDCEFEEDPVSPKYVSWITSSTIQISYYEDEKNDMLRLSIFIKAYDKWEKCFNALENTRAEMTKSDLSLVYQRLFGVLK